jgi:hypothetical protein
MRNIIMAKFIQKIFDTDTQQKFIILALTPDEANYLAALTRDYINPEGENCLKDNVNEPTQQTIHRQRIFDALAGVTQPCSL